MIDIRATKRAMKKKKKEASHQGKGETNSTMTEANAQVLPIVPVTNTSSTITAPKKSAELSTSLPVSSKATTTTSSTPPLAVSNSKLTFTPNFKDQVAEEKRPYALKFHKCRDGGEAYSAAYLCHKEHLLGKFVSLIVTITVLLLSSFPW